MFYRIVNVKKAFYALEAVYEDEEGEETVDYKNVIVLNPTAAHVDRVRGVTYMMSLSPLGVELLAPSGWADRTSVPLTGEFKKTVVSPKRFGSESTTLQDLKEVVGSFFKKAGGGYPIEIANVLGLSLSVPSDQYTIADFFDFVNGGDFVAPSDVTSAIGRALWT